MLLEFLVHYLKWPLGEMTTTISFEQSASRSCWAARREVTSCFSSCWLFKGSEQQLLAAYVTFCLSAAPARSRVAPQRCAGLRGHRGRVAAGHRLHPAPGPVRQQQQRPAGPDLECVALLLRSVGQNLHDEGGVLRPAPPPGARPRPGGAHCAAGSRLLTSRRCSALSRVRVPQSANLMVPLVGNRGKRISELTLTTQSIVNLVATHLRFDGPMFSPPALQWSRLAQLAIPKHQLSLAFSAPAFSSAATDFPHVW